MRVKDGKNVNGGNYMIENFARILAEYRDIYNNLGSSNRVDIQRVIKKTLPFQIQSALNLDPNQYKIVGSYGIGNLTETPWIAIFDREITESAQRGFYIVFLFRKDMSGVYLSLNQGTTYLSNKFKGKKPRDKMREVAFKIREQLEFSNLEFPEQFIELKGKTGNALNYEAANIIAKFYSISSFSAEDILINDIKKMLGLLNDLKRIKGDRSLDEVIDDLLFQEYIIDVKFQQDIQLSEPANTEETPQEVPAKSEYNKSNGWKRNPAIAKESMIKAEYNCEIDRSHQTFISFVTNKNYVEAHHLIPMKYQVNFKYSLDVPGNIVSLCPNCHREIHHSKNKIDIISNLYHERIEQLKKFGLDIDLIELIKAYDIHFQGY